MYRDGQIKFKASFNFSDMNEAVKVSNALKKYKFEVSAIIENIPAYNHREKRMKFILNNLFFRKEPISVGSFYRTYCKSYNCSYKTFQRDIAILLLQDKITATTSFKNGQITLIEVKK